MAGLEPEDVGGDLDEEGVQLSGVPVSEDVGHLSVRQVHHVLHDVVGLRDELHVAVLDAVVHHLDEVPGPFLSDPVAAGVLANLGADGLTRAKQDPV